MDIEFPFVNSCNKVNRRNGFAHPFIFICTYNFAYHKTNIKTMKCRDSTTASLTEYDGRVNKSAAEVQPS